MITKEATGFDFDAFSQQCQAKLIPIETIPEFKGYFIRQWDSDTVFGFETTYFGDDQKPSEEMDSSFRQVVIAWTVVDKTGQRIFTTDEHIKKMKKWREEITTPLFKLCDKARGRQSIEDAVKNSKGADTGGGSTE